MTVESTPEKGIRREMRKVIKKVTLKKVLLEEEKEKIMKTKVMLEHIFYLSLFFI
jgi:hypothetical protein